MSETIKVKGTIKAIKNTQEISDKFKKREFVVTTIDDQYPQDLLLQLTQDRTILVDSYKVGDAVSVSINLRGREWVNKEGVIMYFNTLEAWRIEAASKDTTPKEPVKTEEGEDDLPF